MKPDASDTLVTLGDYVDRGADSRTVLDRLLALADSTHLVPIRGNHDIMMMESRTQGNLYRSQWEQVGGNTTLASYEGILENVPSTHWRFLESTLPFYETATHIFIHAGADSETPMQEQEASTLYGTKLRNPEAHNSGKTVVVGHTSQKNGLPLDFGHTVCIDTYAYGGGWLTCLDMGTGQIYQAGETGDTRRLWRNELRVD